MKALVYHAPGKLAYGDVPDVAPAPGEVRLRPRSTGICGSDVHGYLGLTGRRTPPMVMGHEFAGVVESLGEGVTALRVGDRVAAYPVHYCGTCADCLAGRQHLCAKRRQYGVLSENGAFADFLCVPAKCCYRLADSVSFDVGSLMEPLAVAYRGVHQIPEEAFAGKNVFVVGTGTVGLLAVACLRLLKPAKLIVSDLSDARLAVAEKMGATDTINPGRVGDVAAAVREMTGGAGADVSVEVVGVSAAAQQSTAALRVGGTAIWIGNNRKMIEINMQEIVVRELVVRGSFLYTPVEFEKGVRLLNDGLIDAEPLISHTAPMAEGATYFEKMAKDPGDWIKVILRNEE